VSCTPATELKDDLVVIGASAGGVETLRRVVGGLPRDLRAAVCIVLHLAPDSPSALAGILDRAGPLPCWRAGDGDPLQSGRVLVAPPDRHLVVSDGRVGLTVGPRENGHRPSVDALFRSAAEAKGSRVVGVVLSGMRDDGTAGLALIKAHGGAAIVQDPNEALYGGMPASALAHVQVDAVARSDEVASVIVHMLSEEREAVGSSLRNPGHSDPAGEPVISVCPDCGGVLSEDRGAGMIQWRCKVGHRYSPESLADAQAEGVESTLWAAVRALEDRHALLERMAAQLKRHDLRRSARSFELRAKEAERQAEAVRTTLGRAAETTLRTFADTEHAPETEEQMIDAGS
jgi:two-component system chemotaxis response regulator CheB